MTRRSGRVKKTPGTIHFHHDPRIKIARLCISFLRLRQRGEPSGFPALERSGHRRGAGRLADGGRSVRRRRLRTTHPRRQEAQTRVGEGAVRAWRADGLPGRRVGEDRHAGGWHLLRPGLFGRRWQAVALGHLQCAAIGAVHRFRRTELRSSAPAGFADRAGFRHQNFERRENPDSPLGSRGL